MSDTVSATYTSMPCTSDITTISAVVARITPSSVRKLRSLLEWTLRTAARNASRYEANARMDPLRCDEPLPSFVPLPDGAPQFPRRALGVAGGANGRNHGHAVGSGFDRLARVPGANASNRHQAVVGYGADLRQASQAQGRCGVRLGGGGKHRPDSQIIGVQRFRRARLLDGLDRQADHRIGAQKPARGRVIHVPLSDVNAGGSDGQRHVQAVVGDQGNLKGSEKPRQRPAQFHELPGAAVLFPQLDGRGSAAHRRLDHALDGASAGQPAIGDQVQLPTAPRLHGSRTFRRPRISDSLSRYSASRKRVRNVPGPDAPSAASSPAIPIAAMAFTAASRGDGFTAAKAPASALAVHPMPVTFAIMGCPLEPRATAPPDNTRSTAPLATTTPPVRADSAAAATAASSGACALSTPCVARSPPASARISLGLARTMPGVNSSSSRRAVSVRNVVAPAPTGSSTMGSPFRRAAPPAWNMAAIQGALSVPILITSARAMAVISATSSSAWAMTGDAPSASSALAVTFMTT